MANIDKEINKEEREHHQRNYKFPQKIPSEKHEIKRQRTHNNLSLAGIRKFSILPNSSRHYVRNATISKTFFKSLITEKEHGLVLKQIENGSIFRNVLNFDIIYELLASSETTKQCSNPNIQKSYIVNSFHTDGLIASLLLEYGNNERQFYSRAKKYFFFYNKIKQ